MRIVIEIWGGNSEPKELFNQIFFLYSLWWSFSRWIRRRIFLIVNSNWRKSPWSDSFSCCSRSVWDIWYHISSHGWSRRRHLNICYWTKYLLPLYAKILQWFFYLNYVHSLPVIVSEKEEKFYFSISNDVAGVKISNTMDILEIILDCMSDTFTLIDL